MVPAAALSAEVSGSATDACAEEASEAESALGIAAETQAPNLRVGGPPVKKGQNHQSKPLSNK